MSLVNIDLDAYLSEEDKKQICVDVFRDMARAEIMKNPERIFSNAAYHMVFKMVDDAIDGDTTQVIRDKALDVISKLSEHAVFRPADAWHNGQSLGHKLLHQAIQDNKSILDDKVAEHMSSLDRSWIYDQMVEASREIIERRLFGADADRDDD